ncbi:MAG TPA: ABC transporter ATP-binding protein [Gemmatales bacterium]|nr:ABC transporter ATP-binding protein [Gemmatales bacterium]HMP60613.1 ABC transporter ATP-binding protein [Gemmatales bacterium]
MLLQARQLTKSFPTRGVPLEILRGADLTLDRGEAAAIMGPSGSGKSTLLHLLGTLDRPSAGSVRYEGIDPFTLAEADLADFRNRQIGFVFQDHHLLPQCTVLENTLVPTLVRGEAAQRLDRARALLQRVGLSERLDHRPAELSGGERQRVAVARALINQPLVILADEPTGNLDAVSAAEVGGLLLEMCQAEGAALVVVTHSAELAARFPQRHALRDGRLESERGS